MSTIHFWQQSDEAAAGDVAIGCPDCEYPLTFHQPDPDLPHRLSATCDECKSWFFTRCGTESD